MNEFNDQSLQNFMAKYNFALGQVPGSVEMRKQTLLFELVHITGVFVWKEDRTKGDE